jgi:Fe-S oxidoreductase/nitrate reductase gamma subunit
MDEPTREIFWNIQYPWIMYSLAAIATAVLIWAIYRHYLRWRVGQPTGRGHNLWRRVLSFKWTAIIDGLLHRKFFGVEKPWRFKEVYPGLAHFLIFAGCIVFLLGAFLDAISHYFFDFMHGGFYLGYSVVVDSFGILVVIGVIMAVIRRYVNKPGRLDNKRDDLAALLLILVVVLTGFVIEGLRIAVTELPENASWAPWSPGGYVLALAFKSANPGTILGWHQGLWWFHVLLSLGAIVYVSLFNSRLFHILWDPVNVFFRNLGPKGALTKIDFEKTELFGAGKIEDFTWKQLLDLESCTRCGRCQDACPAYFSGKALNPKQVIQDLKNHLYDVYPRLSSLKPVESRQDMVGEVISDEVAWDCTTCRACQQACPVYIEHVDKIVDLRRNLAMEKSRFPEAAQEALKCLGTRGHPYRGTTATRTTWCEGRDVKTLAEDSEVDILYWVGCSAALDDRNMKVAQATVKVLRAAGVRFGILGDAEACCGDPARRMGDEYLFQTICQQNIETLKSYNVKKIVTACPHCFNSLKYEYPQFGGNYEVVHHSQFIAGLLREGRLKIEKKVLQKAAYHDSCYLGRYNDIYDEPRSIVNALSRHHLELPRHGSNSFCCGGGGGHMWMEEDPAKRVNNRRVDEIVAAGVDCVATACPYCLTMLEDGLKARQAEEKIMAKDISEVVAVAIDGAG